MYARQVGKQTLTLSVSGMLWKRSLVMQDEETESLWSHLLGRAMRGPMKGSTLEVLPSVVTDWRTWRKEHPKSTVVILSRTSKEFRREFYKKPKNFVLGIVQKGRARAYRFDRLARHHVVNDRIAGESVAVLFLPESSTALAYSRRLGKHTLTLLHRDEAFVERETGSRLNPLSGQFVSGPLKGKQLAPLPAVVSYQKAWKTFHPKSRNWTK